MAWHSNRSKSTSLASIKFLPHEQLHQEIQSLINNTNNIEAYKHNEELFWKWMGSSKYESTNHLAIERRMRLGLYHDSMALLQPIVSKLTMQLNELEEHVIMLLLSKKNIKV